MGTRRLNKEIKKFNRSTSFKDFIKENKRKFFLVFGLCFILIFASPFLLKCLMKYLNSLREGPQIEVSASITYDNLANNFDTCPEGLEIAVWEDGNFRSFAYIDENSEVSFMASLLSTYQLKVSQGATITTFDYNMTVGASNDFLIDGWNLDFWLFIDGVPSDDFELWKYIDGEWVWHAIIRTDGNSNYYLNTARAGNYYLGVMVVPMGTYGVISPYISGFYNFSITQTDPIDLYVTMDILDFLKNQKKKKSLNEMKNSSKTNEELFPHTFFFFSCK